MADNARIRVTHEYATNTDSNRSLSRFTEATAAPEFRIELSTSATTAGKTVDLSPWTTITWLVVVNKDATNYVEARYYQQVGTESAGVGDEIAFAAATPDTVSSVQTNGTYVTSGAQRGDWLRVTGAEDSGNDGVWLMQTVAVDTLTVGEDDSLTANTDDETAVLSFETLNTERVAASSWTLIKVPVSAGDLVLTADTAACEVEIWGVATA